MKEIGVLAAGETPSAVEAADAQATLNRRINLNAAQRLQIFSVTRTAFAIVSGTGAYSVAGITGVPRPTVLDHVNYQDTSVSPTIEYPLGLPLTNDQYAEIRMKGLTGTFPTSWYYSPTFPTGTLSFFPVPTSTTLQGVTYAPQPIASLPLLTTVVDLPPGYEEMLVTDLAIALAPSYGRQVDPILRERAKEAKGIVKAANETITDLSFPVDSLIGGRPAWSIYSGP